jgi:hypothetical protein
MFIIVGAEKKIKMVTVVTLPKKEIFPRKLLGIVYSHENNQIFKFQFSAPFKSARPGSDPLCHSERSRTLCGEVEESVLFTLF